MVGTLVIVQMELSQITPPVVLISLSLRHGEGEEYFDGHGVQRGVAVLLYHGDFQCLDHCLSATGHVPAESHEVTCRQEVQKKSLVMENWWIGWPFQEKVT